MTICALEEDVMSGCVAEDVVREAVVLEARMCSSLSS